MKVDGTVRAEATSRGAMDGIHNPVSPLPLISETMEIVPPGRVPEGLTEIPFEFPVPNKPSNNVAKTFYESYHGVYISVCYVILVECERGMMSRPLHREMEFVLEVPIKVIPDRAMHEFRLTRESLENVKPSAKVPDFIISGVFHNTNCAINKPFTGEIVVEMSETPIKSIEIQLVRVESIRDEQQAGTERTEIQNLQIAEDDVCLNMPIYLHMILPRLFTCITANSSKAKFSIEFELNLIVIFETNYMVTEKFPINIYRE